MPRKTVLILLVSGLLIAGFFYFKQKGPDLEPFPAGKENREKVADIAGQAEVLGQETDKDQIKAESTQDEFKKEIKGFSGCLEDQININLACAVSLESLEGIGPVIAGRIVEERQKTLFYSLDDLTRVYRIGTGTVANIKEQGIACAGDLNEGLAFLSSDDQPAEKEEDEKEPEEKAEEDEEDVSKEEDREEEAGERDFDGCQNGQINLNSASKEDLTEITQIGPAYAAQIIELRSEELFWSVDDLDRVSGISLGGSRLEAIIKQGLACAADADDKSFEPFEKKDTSVSSPASSSASDPEPAVNLSYAAESPADKEIEITFSASNLKEAFYDVKIAIEKEGVLSRIYNTASGEWISSNFYLTRVFSGTSFEGQFKLKIREDRSDFQGEADIIARLRENGKSGYLASFAGKINIIEPESSSSEEPADETATEEEIQCRPESININTASQEELEMIVHITSSRAEEIISLREDVLFSSVEDLTRVFGIGESRVADIKEQGCAYVDIEEEDEAKEEEPEPEEEALIKEFSGCQEGQININAAGKDHLQLITQIGLSRAEQIIQLRQELPFYSLEDLERVSGIAEVIISQIKEQGLACTDCPSQTFFVEEEQEDEPEEQDEEAEEFEGCQDGQININAAGKESLTEIYQIGEARADQIIELREIEPFWSIDDMVRISGIGEVSVQGIKDQGLACAADPN